MRAQFITASEVAEIMGISRSKAYQIVREMNRELKASIDVQLRTSEHRSMYSYVRLSIDRCTATYV